MRDIKITYNHIKNIRARAETIIKDLEKRDLLDDEFEEEILAAKSLDALDHLVSDFIESNSIGFIDSKTFSFFLDVFVAPLVCTIQSSQQIIIV